MQTTGEKLLPVRELLIKKKGGGIEKDEIEKKVNLVLMPKSLKKKKEGCYAISRAWQKNPE